MSRKTGHTTVIRLEPRTTETSTIGFYIDRDGDLWFSPRPDEWTLCYPNGSTQTDRPGHLIPVTKLEVHCG